MKYLCFAIFSICSLIATPTTHTMFAEMYLDTINHEYTEDDLTAFFQGVLYPDIHYLQVISKNETTVEDVTLDDVISEGVPFFAGQKLHSLINTHREQFVEASQILDVFEPIASENIPLYLKIIEDDRFYETIDSQAISNRVYSVHPSEDFGQVPYHALKTWHRVLGQYFSMRPSTIMRRLRQFNLGFFGVPYEEVSIWSYSMAGYMEREEVQSYLTGLVDHFGALFEACNGVLQALDVSDQELDLGVL